MFFIGSTLKNWHLDGRLESTLTWRDHWRLASSHVVVHLRLSNYTGTWRVLWRLATSHEVVHLHLADLGLLLSLLLLAGSVDVGLAGWLLSLLAYLLLASDRIWTHEFLQI